MIMGFTLVLVLAAIAAAYQYIVRKEKGIMPAEENLPLWQRLIARKYYIDELYGTIVEKPVLWLSEKFHGILELRFIDRIVNGFGEGAVRAAGLVRWIQTGNVGFYMFMMIIGMMLILIFNLLI
jgi:NADH-quinone oxidoreductase subunit L